MYTNIPGLVKIEGFYVSQLFECDQQNKLRKEVREVQ